MVKSLALSSFGAVFCKHHAAAHKNNGISPVRLDMITAFLQKGAEAPRVTNSSSNSVYYWNRRALIVSITNAPSDSRPAKAISG